MKGLLRGMKYLSQVFEVEKEPEMQIGSPTDVKHVAHIGMDGPSANKPSWIDGFNSELSPSSASNSNQEIKPLAEGNHDSMPPAGNEKKKKSSRRKQSVESSSSPVGSPRASEKQSRRHRTSKLSIESPTQDSSSQERPKKSCQEVPETPKKSRQKKSKESSGGSEESMLSCPDDKILQS